MLAAVAEAESASFQGLGILPGADLSSAVGVSADGSVVVGHSVVVGERSEVFRWTAEEDMVGLGFSGAAAISADGSVVVGSGDTAEGFEAFRWTAEGGMVGLGYLHEGEVYSRTSGVSADGSVVVGQSYETILRYEGFLWTAEDGMVGLGRLTEGNGGSYVAAVSADGEVVVGANRSFNPFGRSGGEAFRWTPEDGMVSLGLLPDAEGSAASAISADGLVVVGTSYVGEWFEWLTYTPSGLWIWDEIHGMRDLENVLVNELALGQELAGWELLEATDISDDGTVIIGYGINPSGQEEAWRAVIPEPSTLWLLLCGVLCLVVFGWGRLGCANVS